MRISYYLLILLSSICFFFSTVYAEQDSFKSTYQLELKKGITIRPSDTEEGKEPFFRTCRKSLEQDTILLYSQKPEVKIYQFDSSGKYRGKFLSYGEGPGELLTIVNLQILGDRIIVNDNKKYVFYDNKGKETTSGKFKKRLDWCKFISPQEILIKETRLASNNLPICEIAITDIAKPVKTRSIFLDEKRQDIGIMMINMGTHKSMTYHDKLTIDYVYTYLPKNKLIVGGVSDKKTLFVKNLDGKIIRSKEIDFPKKKLTSSDREKFIDSFARFKKIPPMYKGLKESIYEYFPPIASIKLLPQDHFAVFLQISYKGYEVRIYDKNLKHISTIVFPQYIIDSIEDLKRIQFYEKGIYFFEENGEDLNYIEYEITNLKQILGS